MIEVDDERRAELATRLEQVRERITSATRDAGRDEEPTLVVVTKFFPVSDLVALAELGVTDVGESREQELHEKVDSLREERPDLLKAPTRHFIGQLQSKKAKRVASLVDVVQSLDRPKLVPLLDAAGAERDTPLEVLLQVDLEENSQGRGGVAPAELAALADEVAQASGLTLSGLMAVAPRGEEPERAFERLAALRESFLADHPAARVLSAGMSGDLEAAVKIGATHLRVGSAILGSRPAAR
ncbi:MULTISPECIES: YggS family pyridoxal phosphate-dependent enzyme [Dermacoccus]|uniref:Pyridoxal phosphate homeostasis protein n=1 Tax=Dermacoccus barathri TaxID=322601 RepID=A0ABN2BZJ6_9MICO|nr:YggS family pyridoxal phosphate-dependent enzyme [Dermacoccus sp. 147Ba]